MSFAPDSEEAMQRDREERATRLRYFRETFARRDALIAIATIGPGLREVRPYRGGGYDRRRYRIVAGGWTHDHCSVCAANVDPGADWWASYPPDQVGLCLACHARLIAE